MHDADGVDSGSPAGSRTPARMSFGRFLLETAALLLVAWVIAQGILTYVAQQYEIPSTSMENTLQVGDRVLVNKLAYRFGTPSPGEVVVFLSPDDPDKDWVKRVVAVGGQTVDVRDDVVYVDGEALTEPYANLRYRAHYTADGPVRVPEGTVYVMGDNRGNSRDSRIVGPQPISRILGRAEAIVWPLARAGAL